MHCDTPIYVDHKNPALGKIPLPCNHCPNCKKRRVEGWVFRCMQEDLRSVSSYFVTLTYDTSTVPISGNGFMTLKKKDLQDYMKRLRKLCPSYKLKYYACGEYGTKNKRPHYHMILFNCPNPQFIFDAWKLGGVPIGHVHVGQVNSSSIAYTMKYIDKSKWKPMHLRDDRIPEYAVQSNGLGSNYVTPEIVAYHNADISRLYVTLPGGIRQAMPRYYRKKIFDEDTMKAQLPIIQSAVRSKEEKERRNFERLYDGCDITFDTFRDEQRFARYRSFYSQQKDRDI